MNSSLSANAQAILLATAPLMAGAAEPSADLLTPGEYKRLARFLRDKEQEPAALLGPDAGELLRDRLLPVESERLRHLLARGFLLSQATERWQTRAIWIVCSSDTGYPERFKTRLRHDAPPVIYGCGDASILDTGGLAVVGSRHVDDALITYTESVGRLAAEAGCTLCSGGARGVDQAAMRGALEAGGKVAGVLCDSLERAALNRDNREFLIDGRLVLASPYDPSAGFNVGHAMQRNKLIYALADAGLVVSSDYEKGGTWAGAVEQLEKLHFVPVYVRANGDDGKGIRALRGKGALLWPNPRTPEALAAALVPAAGSDQNNSVQNDLFSNIQEMTEESNASPRDTPLSARHSENTPSAADELFTKVRELLGNLETRQTEAQIAAYLNVSKGQAREWLTRLVEEGVMEKHSKPARYGPRSQRSLLE